MNEITINELFSGIGAVRKAFINNGIPYKVVGISEIDKHAIASYKAMYGDTYNYGDISKIDKLNYADMWVYGFPCQDISVAGKMKGIVKSETRSGLLFEVERLLEKAVTDKEPPKYLLMENVKNLIGKRFKNEFDKWLQKLDDLGYNNYWKILDAQDYNIPQHRERVFCVSIRKDLGQNFEFPKEVELVTCMQDYLEDEVDEKYFIAQLTVDNLVKSNAKQAEKGNGFRFSPVSCDGGDVAHTIQTKAGRTTDNYIDYGSKKRLILLGKIPSGITPTYTNRFESVMGVYSPEGLVPTLQTFQGGGQVTKIADKKSKIRKLTPLECWRLMGFTDEDFIKAKEFPTSDTQLYKQAGNSICVPVLEAILNSLLSKEASNATA